MGVRLSCFWGQRHLGKASQEGGLKEKGTGKGFPSKGFPVREEEGALPRAHCPTNTQNSLLFGCY